MKTLAEIINKKVVKEILEKLKIPPVYVQSGAMWFVHYNIEKVERDLVQGLEFNRNAIEESELKKIVDDIIKEYSVNDLLLSDIKYLREEGKRRAEAIRDGWGYVNTMSGIGQK